MGAFMRGLAMAVACLACSAPIAQKVPVAADPPWDAPVPQEDAEALLVAFIRADAWGLQTRGEHWPLIARFTTWADGPGWDAVSVIETAEVVARRHQGRRAEFVVRFRLLGTLHADGERMPVLEAPRRREERIVFHLSDTGRAGHSSWRLVSPQDRPRVSVGYATLVLLADWCGSRDCGATEAYRTLAPHHAACVRSPIPLNRACSTQANRFSSRQPERSRLWPFVWTASMRSRRRSGPDRTRGAPE